MNTLMTLTDSISMLTLSLVTPLVSIDQFPEFILSHLPSPWPRWPYSRVSTWTYQLSMNTFSLSHEHLLCQRAHFGLFYKHPVVCHRQQNFSPLAILRPLFTWIFPNFHEEKFSQDMSKVAEGPMIVRRCPTLNCLLIITYTTSRSTLSSSILHIYSTSR